jgi:AcrR family transcriptional regulator
VPRAKQRTEQLRDHIVQVAVAMLAVDGVGGFTARNVAARAQTSPPAVYELFGDKAGLVREVFFEGFRLLGDRFGKLKESDDPRADLIRMVGAFRVFVRENPVLAQVMFSRPFADFDPGPGDLAAGRKPGNSSWAGSGAASTPGSSRATRPTSPTGCTPWPRDWRCRRLPAGSALPARR